MRKLHYDISSAKQNNKDLEKQVKTFRTYCQNKEDEYHHKIDKMKQEVDDWQEKCGLHVGKT